jgi:hypothetical protein
MTDEEVKKINKEFCAKLVKISCQICCRAMGYGTDNHEVLCFRCYNDWK